MIVVENDQSDAASTNTLVTSTAQRIPKHYLLLISISCIVSILAFCFVLVDVAVETTILAVPVILAYTLFLPYQGAALLLHWLQRHQTESIFPFTPASRRAIAYALFLLVLWGASMVTASIRLHSQVLSYPLVRDTTCYVPIPNNGTVDTSEGSSSFTYTFIDCQMTYGPIFYWPSIASVIATSLQSLLLVGIISVCWRHRKTADESSLSPPHSTSPMSESKILSA